MKRSDFYLGLASLIAAIEVTFSAEHGWMFAFGVYMVVGIGYLFKEGAE